MLGWQTGTKELRLYIQVSPNVIAGLQPDDNVNMAMICSRVELNTDLVMKSCMASIMLQHFVSVSVQLPFPAYR